MTPQETRLLFGVANLSAGSHSTAQEYLKVSVEQEYSPDAASLLIDALTFQGKLDEARAVASKYRIEHPQEPQVWIDQGYLRLISGDLQGAVEDAQTALRLHPSDPRAHLLFAEAKRAEGKLDDAAMAFERVRNSLGTLGARAEYRLLSLREAPSTAKEFLKARLQELTLDYHDRLWWLNEALLLDDRAVIESLLSQFGESDPTLLVELARHRLALYAEKDSVGALRIARRLVEAYPESGYAYYALASSFDAARRRRAAAAAYRRAAELIPRSAVAAYQAARSSLLAWQPWRGMRWAAQAVELDPSSADAMRVLVVCKMLCGRISEAIALKEENPWIAYGAGKADHAE